LALWALICTPELQLRLSSRHDDASIAHQGLRTTSRHIHAPLCSGQVSSTCFDKYRFDADPILLREIAVDMAKLVPPGTEVLAGLEMGGIPVPAPAACPEG